MDISDWMVQSHSTEVIIVHRVSKTGWFSFIEIDLGDWFSVPLSTKSRRSIRTIMWFSGDYILPRNSDTRLLNLLSSLVYLLPMKISSMCILSDFVLLFFITNPLMGLHYLWFIYLIADRNLYDLGEEARRCMMHEAYLAIHFQLRLRYYFRVFLCYLTFMINWVYFSLFILLSPRISWLATLRYPDLMRNRQSDWRGDESSIFKNFLFNTILTSESF